MPQRQVHRESRSNHRPSNKAKDLVPQSSKTVSNKPPKASHSQVTNIHNRAGKSPPPSASLPSKTVRSLARKAAPRAIGFAQHLTFFDEDGDGTISQTETRRGLEKLGLGKLLSVPGAALVNFGVAGLARAKHEHLDPARLSVARASFVRHPDTRLIDDAGHFDAARLDAVLDRYGKRFNGEALSLAEILTMSVDRTWRIHQNPRDMLLVPGGIAATLVEWMTLWWVAKTPREGRDVLSKSDVVRFYTDEHFFHEVSDRIAEARRDRATTRAGRVRNALQAWVI